MALSTQILLLCLCSFLVESFFFELGGQDLHRIPLGLSEFMLYPGMFDPPHIRYPHITHSHKDTSRGKLKGPFISPIIPDTTTEVTTTTINDVNVELKTQTLLEKEPLVDQKVFLTKNVNVSDSTEAPSEEKKGPFTSADVTTVESKATDEIAPVTTIQEPTTSDEEDIEVKIQSQRKRDPLESKTVFLTRNVNINDATEAMSDEKEEFQVNALSINDVKPEPILSITVPHDSEEEETKKKVQESTDIPRNTSKTNDTNTDSSDQENKDDPALSKNTDFLLVPVAAVNPSTFNAILNSNPNTMAPMGNLDNYQNNNQVYTIPNGQNNLNPGVQFGNTPNQNMNSINPGISSYQDNSQVYPNGRNNLNTGVPYGNGPNQYINNVNPGLPLSTAVNPSNNIAPNNLYTMTTVPNGQGFNNGNVPNNNLYYLQNNPNSMNSIGYQNPNTQQLYNLVPINSAPNNVGWNQQPNLVPPNNQQYFVPINNQPNNFVGNTQPNNFVPNNNQPNNFVPFNNQPNNFVPINNQPNNFVGNNQPNNVVPVNNQPTNFVPLNNHPNNFVGNNQLSNVIPINNQPNNFVPLNNQPNNFVGNNQPNNYGPWNNQPNNYPYNNNYVPVNNVPNNYVPINGPNNFVPINNQPTNFVPFNDQQNQPLDNQPVVLDTRSNAPLLVQPLPDTVTLVKLEEEEKKE